MYIVVNLTSEVIPQLLDAAYPSPYSTSRVIWKFYGRLSSGEDRLGAVSLGLDCSVPVRLSRVGLTIHSLTFFLDFRITMPRLRVDPTKCNVGSSTSTHLSGFNLRSYSESFQSIIELLLIRPSSIAPLQDVFQPTP